MDFALPDAVKDYVRNIFFDANQHVAAALSTTPTLHEVPLDQFLLHRLRCNPAAKTVAENWVVRIDAKYTGGGAHFGHWEIADIGLLVLFRRAGRVVRTKLVLLQSKRLYPLEQSLAESGRFYLGSEPNLVNKEWLRATESVSLTFDADSRYRALRCEDEQWKRVAQFEEQRELQVYYQLYNPLNLPERSVFPIEMGAGQNHENGEVRIGTRILPFSALRDGFKDYEEGYSPSYSDLQRRLPHFNDQNSGGWRLEDFVTDLVLGCKEGYVTDDIDDPKLTRATSIFQRGAPIWAAITIAIDALE